MTITSFQEPFFLFQNNFSLVLVKKSAASRIEKMKYILVTGGVISGIGNGVVARLVSCLFFACWFTNCYNATLA